MARRPCPAALKKALIEWWGPIVLEYHSGSQGVGLTLIDSVETRVRPGSVGRGRRGTLHIADKAGHALPAGATSLVCFSGVAPFAYCKAPEKTAARSCRKDGRPSATSVTSTKRAMST